LPGSRRREEEKGAGEDGSGGEGKGVPMGQIGRVAGRPAQCTWEGGGGKHISGPEMTALPKAEQVRKKGGQRKGPRGEGLPPGGGTLADRVRVGAGSQSPGCPDHPAQSSPRYHRGRRCKPARRPSYRCWRA